MPIQESPSAPSRCGDVVSSSHRVRHSLPLTYITSLNMSVPYNINQQKEQASQDLLVGAKGALRASEKIPLIARGHVSDRAKKTLDIVSGTIHRFNSLRVVLTYHPTGRALCRRRMYPGRRHCPTADRRGRCQPFQLTPTHH